MIVMAADKQGYEIVQFLSKRGENIEILVLDENNRKNMNESIIHEVNLEKCRIIYYDELKSEDVFEDIRKKEIDFGILAWWPYIISKKEISLTRRGFVNTHPAFLPYQKELHLLPFSLNQKEIHTLIFLDFVFSKFQNLNLQYSLNILKLSLLVYLLLYNTLLLTLDLFFYSTYVFLLRPFSSLEIYEHILVL